MLIRVLSGQKPDEIVNARLDFIEGNWNDDTPGANPFERFVGNGKANEELCAGI